MGFPGMLGARKESVVYIIAVRNKLALLLLGIVAALCLFFSYRFFSFDVLAASQDPSGHWHGTGWSRRVSDLKWVTLATDYQTDFWFTLNASGDLQGTAVVKYSLSFDDTPLRTLIALPINRRVPFLLSPLGSVDYCPEKPTPPISLG
jgi:hypothetical protein